MWICRRCAAHVEDQLLSCPCCATPAPARLQPELAHNVSDRLSEAPRREHINWLTHKALPNLRKQAESPWAWATSGFGLGFGIGFGYGGGFRGDHPLSRLRHTDLSEPILCGVAFGVVLGLLGAVLRWRLNRKIHPAELGAIFGFFLIVSLAVIHAFTKRRGWESLEYLSMNYGAVGAPAVTLAVLGAVTFWTVALLWNKIAIPLVRRLGFRGTTDKLPLRADLTKTDTVTADQLSTEAHRTEVFDPQKSDRLDITDGNSCLRPNSSSPADNFGSGLS